MSPHEAASRSHKTPAIETRPLNIACEGETLLGMLTLPKERVVEKALLVVTGGPQYRVGSHRLFMQLGRWMAEQGIAVLRFDSRGAGDSTGQPLPFTDRQADIAAALQALRSELGDSLVDIGLFGLCDGASAALMYCHEHPDADVQRLILLNPWVHSPETHAQVQLKHYYFQRLQSPDFWKRLFAGKVGPRAMTAVLRHLMLMIRSRTTAPSASVGSSSKADSTVNIAGFQNRMREGLLAFQGSVLVILSEHDFTAAEFREACAHDSQWRKAIQRPHVQVKPIEGADHTFSAGQTKRLLLKSLTEFMNAHSEFRAARTLAPSIRGLAHMRPKRPNSHAK